VGGSGGSGGRRAWRWWRWRRRVGPGRRGRSERAAPELERSAGVTRAAEMWARVGRERRKGSAGCCWRSRWECFRARWAGSLRGRRTGSTGPRLWVELGPRGSGLPERREGGSGPWVCWPRRRGGARTGLRKWAASGKGGRPDWVSCWVGFSLWAGLGLPSSFSNKLKPHSNLIEFKPNLNSHPMHSTN
jgi:hypothetical protein